MFDIDAGHARSLRLVQATDTDAELADIERQMEALSLRHCELMEAKRVAHAQSRPIAVGDSVSGSFTVRASDPGLVFGGDSPASPVVGIVTGVHHDGDSAIISFRGGGSNLSTDNDFWTHRHRIMTGGDPKIARTTGHIERLNAAARGEIADPAEAIRASQVYNAYNNEPVKISFVKGTGLSGDAARNNGQTEFLHEDDGA